MFLKKSWLKRFVLSVFLFFGLLNIHFVSAQTSVDSQLENWLIYRDDIYGYQIKYPAEYEIIEKAFDDVGGVPSDKWFGENIHIISRIPALDDDFVSKYWSTSESVTLESGEYAFRRENTSNSGLLYGEPTIVIEYLFRGNGADYFVKYEGVNPESQEELEQRNIFESIINSFQLLSSFSYVPPLHALAADANGFDFFVDQPDGGTRAPWYTSYNANNPYLTSTSGCYNKPYSQLQHTAEDWFRNAGTPVYAVANGRVIYVHPHTYPGNVIIVEHTLGNGWSNPWGGNIIYSVYAHVDAQVSAWSDVVKGQQIATVMDYPGDGNNHIHFEIRKYGDMTNILKCPSNDTGSFPGPGYTDAGVNPDNYGYTNPSAWIDGHRSGGTSSNCDAPSLSSPSDGYVSSSQTINFSWNSISGCTYNGYTFRINDSSNMEDSPIIDTGVGETSKQVTIGSEWNNRDLWWGVKAANAPNGASWAVRRFRIEPSSGPEHSVQFYKNANYDDGYCYGDNAGNYMNIDGCSGYNDQISSVLLKSGWSVRVYEHADLGGGWKCYTSSDSDFSNDVFNTGVSVNDKMSSFSLYNQSSCPALTPDPPSLSSPSNGYYFNEGDSITLSWTDTGDDYYGEVWGGPGGTTTFGWQSGTSKTIGSQWAGYTYSWHIKAKNSGGESLYSSTRTFTVRPGTPSNLSASAASCNQINLSWNDNSGNEEGYKIYRGGSLIATVGSGATSYQNTGLSENTNYSYTVKAYRGTILSNVSNTASATTGSCGPAVRAVGQWTADGSWNQKTTFTVGDPIQWVINVENTTGSDATFELIYDVKDNFGNVVVYWDGNVTTSSGTLSWGLPGTLPSEAGLHEFRGKVIYEGQTTELSMVYSVELPDPPSNDDFGSPISISPTNSISLDTRGATQNGDDPVIPNCNMNAGSATVWYKYTPSSNSAISLDTKTSDYDTFIAVWTGTRTNLSPVVCNDDIDYANGITQSAVAFRVQANVTYYIEIGEWDGSYGASANALDAKEKNLIPTFPLWETEPEKLE